MKTQAVSKPAAKPVAPTTPAPEAQAPAQTPKVVVIKVLKKDAKLRGAREAWYKELLKWDGKSKAEFEKHCEANPPSKPTKGKLAGKGEPPSGWTSYFKRTGLASYEEVEVKA